MRFSRRLANIPTVVVLDTDARIRALGQATVVDVGTEYVYLEKAGVRYCFKPQSTAAFMKGALDCSELRVFRDSSICPPEPKACCALRLVKTCRCPSCQC